MSIPNTSLKRNRAVQTFNSDIIYTPIQAVFVTNHSTNAAM